MFKVQRTSSAAYFLAPPHFFVPQIVRGAGPAAGVRGGCIFFSGKSSEHRVAFQHLATLLLKSDNSVHYSCNSLGSELPITKALQLLEDKSSFTFRWARV